MDCSTNTSNSPRFTAWQWLKQDSWLEYSLILSIFTLLLQVLGPPLMDWWHLPRPGRVGMDWLPQDFYEGNSARAISSRYVCSLPTDYAQADTWPLLVYLHGAGERGNNPQTLVRRAQFLSASISQEFPAIVLVTQCVSQRSWQPWDVTDFVENACHRYRIDRDRIYLVGYSMGGYGTWATAAADAELFAAIVPIAGGHDPEDATALVEIPIWALHGAVDDVVPVDQTTGVVEAIRAAGGNPKLTVYPEVGHGILSQVYESEAMWHWLFEQRLSNRSPGERMEPVASRKGRD